MTGRIMSSSQAVGCFVVFQGACIFPDIFRALLKTRSRNIVSTTIPLLSSNYTVYGYDLEENGLPNTMPAVVLESHVSTSYPGYEMYMKANH